MSEDSYTSYLKEPRYDVSLQKDTEPACFQKFYNCSSLVEAKEQAESRAKETGRAVMVYDRREFAIILLIPATKPIEIKQEVVEPKKKKGKK